MRTRITRRGQRHWVEILLDEWPHYRTFRSFPTVRAARACQQILESGQVGLEQARRIVADDVSAALRHGGRRTEPEVLRSECEHFALTFDFNSGIPFPEAARFARLRDAALERSEACLSFFLQSDPELL